MAPTARARPARGHPLRARCPAQVTPRRPAPRPRRPQRRRLERLRPRRRRPPHLPLRGPFDLPEPERYARGHLLGSGGMGRVTQAFDRRLGREVALKEATLPTPEHEARLAREAALTARLDHPGVVVVHDAGRSPDGALFYTMRVVRGRTLDVALRAAPDLDARLRLLRHVRDACEAVAFAHRHGIVHRDLKPANVMVGEFGETQVLDWGLARPFAAPPDPAAPPHAHAPPRPALAAPAPPDPAAPPHAPAAPSPALTPPPDDPTRLGAVVGTPRYMSPEQAAGAPATPRSDVFGLGAVLFEVCAGHPARALPDPLPDAPAALAALARAPLPDLRRAAPSVPPDLTAIASRALAPDPAARYPDAKALADDLTAFIDGRRVAAHAYTPWDLLRRLARAWRVPLAIGATALLATAIGLALAFSAADAERDRALAAESTALAAESTALAAESTARAAESTARGALADADRALARSLVTTARDFARDDARPEAEVLAARAFALDPTPVSRGLLLALAASPRPELLATLALPPACRHPEVAPDLSTLVCADERSVSLYDLTLSPAGLRHRWSAPVRASWGATPFPAAGLVVSAGPPYPLEAFALADGARRTVRPLACCAYPPRVSDAGTAVAFAGNAQLGVLTPTAVHELSPCATREEQAGAIDATGSRWAVSCRDGALFVGTLGATPERFTTPVAVPRGPATALAFAPDGHTLLLGTSDGALVVYDTASRRVLHDVPSGVAMTRAVAASPDGRWAAVLGEHGGPRLFDLPSGTWRGRLPHTAVRALRFAAGRPADLVTLDTHLRLWRLHPGAPSTLAVGGGVTGLAVAPDGRRLGVTRGKGVEVRDLADGAALAASGDLGAVVKPGAFSPDGTAFAAAVGAAKRVERWDLGELAPFAAPLEAGYPLRQVVALSGPDGAPLWVAAPHFSGLYLWPGADLAPLPTLRDAPDPRLVQLAVSADQRRLVALDDEAHIFVLDAAAPILERRFEHPGALALALDPTATAVLLGEAGGASLRRLDDGALVRVLHAPERRPIAVAVSPDGRFAAAGDVEGQVTLWHLPSGALQAVFRDHTRRATALAFGPDSAWLATGSWDETVRLRALDLSPLTSTPAHLERAWDLPFADVLGRP